MEYQEGLYKLSKKEIMKIVLEPKPMAAVKICFLYLHRDFEPIGLIRQAEKIMCNISAIYTL